MIRGASHRCGSGESADSNNRQGAGSDIPTLAAISHEFGFQAAAPLRYETDE